MRDVLGIAANCLATADRLDEARAFAALIHRTHPRYCVDDFLGAFRFSPDAATLFRQAADRIGIG